DRQIALFTATDQKLLVEQGVLGPGIRAFDNDQTVVALERPVGLDTGWNRLVLFIRGRLFGFFFAVEERDLVVADPNLVSMFHGRRFLDTSFVDERACLTLEIFEHPLVAGTA